MNHPQPVIIKRGIAVPSLLENFIDFAFTEIRNNNSNFGRVCSTNASLDTQFRIRFRKNITNSADRFVDVQLGNNTGIRINANNVMASEIRRFTSNGNRSLANHQLKLDFMEASKHVEAIECKGLYIDHLLGYVGQNPFYLALKIAIVVNDMLTMNKRGVDRNIAEFITKFNSGYVKALVRHAQKPRDASSGFRIAWHRNSNTNNQEKGMVTTGIYIHRPQGIQEDSGGISFAKDGKEVRLFPTRGTVVSFLDQHVMHKVIPIKLNPNNRLPDNQHGFVQRSAVFLSWHTNQSLINTHGTNINKAMFSKVGISGRFRDLKKLYVLLNQYFVFVHRKHAIPNGKNLNSFINSASPDKIEAAYRGHGANAANAANYGRILAEGSYAPTNNTPVADLILYKQRRMANNTPRTKLKNLRTVYKNLQKTFGNVGAGVTRRNKTSLFAKRGGRIAHNVTSSGFIRNVTNNNAPAPAPGPTPINNGRRPASRSLENIKNFIRSHNLAVPNIATNLNRTQIRRRLLAELHPNRGRTQANKNKRTHVSSIVSNYLDI